MQGVGLRRFRQQLVQRVCCGRLGLALRQPRFAIPARRLVHGSAAVRASRARRGAGSKAKNEWLRRQAADPYVRQAQEEGWRSRACFKLDAINRKLRVLRPGMQVVDLGSAPGGWMQVAAQSVLRQAKLVPGAVAVAPSSAGHDDDHGANQPCVVDDDDDDDDDAVDIIGLMSGSGQPRHARTTPEPRSRDPTTPAVGKFLVVGVDLLPMAPLPGTLTVQGDFTKPEVQQFIRSHMRRTKADTVLSDMAHSFVGVGSLDHDKQIELAQQAFTFSLLTLKWGGNFVVKVLQGSRLGELKNDMEKAFSAVHIVKPPASRARSPETFLVGVGFRPNAKLMSARGVHRDSLLVGEDRT